MLLLVLLVIQPEHGAHASTRTLNMDIVQALVSLLTLFAGYLVGDMQGNGAKGEE